MGFDAGIGEAAIASAAAPELMTALESMAAGGASQETLGQGIVAATQADLPGFQAMAGVTPPPASSSLPPWLIGANGAPGPATQWAMVLNQLKGLVPQGSQGMAGSGPPPLHASIPPPTLLGSAPNYSPPQAATMGGGGGGQGLAQLLAMLQKMGGR